MKKPAIPQPAASTDKAVLALKENVEILTARRGTAITQLKTTATNAEIIAKINEMLTLLQS